jgi:hypothetical protein
VLGQNLRLERCGDLLRPGSSRCRVSRHPVLRCWSST